MIKTPSRMKCIHFSNSQVVKGPEWSRGGEEAEDRSESEVPRARIVDTDKVRMSPTRTTNK